MTQDVATLPDSEQHDASGDVSRPNALHSSRPALPPTETDASGFMAALKNRDFFFLWLSQVMSQLADKFIMFTLVIVVYKKTGLASTESLLMIAFTFPSVILSAPAGVFVDRHDKRLLMFGTNIIRAALIMTILVLLLTLQSVAIIPLLIVVFIFSSVGQVYAPAEAASIPSLVDPDMITAATSLFMTTVILTIVVGIPLATLSIGLFGQDAPFLVAAGLFLGAGASLLGVGKNLKSVPVGSAPKPRVWKEFKEGLSLLKDHPVLRMALLELSLALTVVFTVFVLGPSYLSHVLHQSPNNTYIVLIPATLGMIGIALVLARRHDVAAHAGTLAIFSSAVSGIVLLLLGFGPPFVRSLGYHGSLVIWVMLIGVLFGLALGTLLIPAFVSLQENSTNDVRGRIFGGVFTVINAAIAIPLVLAGTLADHFGVGKVIGGVGIILILIALAGGTVLRHELRQMEEAAAR